MLSKAGFWRRGSSQSCFLFFFHEKKRVLNIITLISIQNTINGRIFMKKEM